MHIERSTNAPMTRYKGTEIVEYKEGRVRWKKIGMKT